MRTMWIALKICLPITLMTFAIFTRDKMVVTTGWPQFVDTALVLIGTCGFAFAMFGRFTRRPASDMTLRLALAAIAAFVLFYPNDNGALAAAPFCALATIVGVMRHARIAPPAELSAEASGSGQDLGALIADARREV